MDRQKLGVVWRTCESKASLLGLYYRPCLTARIFHYKKNSVLFIQLRGKESKFRLEGFEVHIQFTREFILNQVRSGQARSGQVRSGQVTPIVRGPLGAL